MPEDLKSATIHLHKTGTRPDLRNLKPKDILFEDICHNLCRLPRFTCNTSRLYTVAEHSLLVMQILDDAQAPLDVMFQGLCHDFPEYLTGDISAPVKSCVPEIREFEAKLWGAITKTFGIREEMDPQVKHADWVALFIEATALCPTAKLKEWENFDLYKEEVFAWIDKYGLIDGSRAMPTRLLEHTFIGAFSTLWQEMKACS